MEATLLSGLLSSRSRIVVCPWGEPAPGPDHRFHGEGSVIRVCVAERGKTGCGIPCTGALHRFARLLSAGLHKPGFEREVGLLLAQILRLKGDGVVCSSQSIRLREAAAALIENEVGALVICGADGSVDGVFSERDLVSAVAQCGESAMEASVSIFLRAGFPTARPEDDVSLALHLMTDRRVRHLPVLHERKLVGLVSIGDLVKWRIAEADADADAMRAYIQH